MMRILFITIITNLLGLAASAQTISGMIPDSAYTPLLKAARQHVFNKSNATQNSYPHLVPTGLMKTAPLGA